MNNTQSKMSEQEKKWKCNNCFRAFIEVFGNCDNCGSDSFSLVKKSDGSVGEKRMASMSSKPSPPDSVNKMQPSIHEIGQGVKVTTEGTSMPCNSSEVGEVFSFDDKHKIVLESQPSNHSSQKQPDEMSKIEPQPLAQSVELLDEMSSFDKIEPQPSAPENQRVELEQPAVIDQDEKLHFQPCDYSYGKPLDEMSSFKPAPENQRVEREQPAVIGNEKLSVQPCDYSQEKTPDEMSSFEPAVIVQGKKLLIQPCQEKPPAKIEAQLSDPESQSVEWDVINDETLPVQTCDNSQEKQPNEISISELQPSSTESQSVEMEQPATIGQDEKLPCDRSKEKPFNETSSSNNIKPQPSATENQSVEKEHPRFDTSSVISKDEEVASGEISCNKECHLMRNNCKDADELSQDEKQPRQDIISEQPTIVSFLLITRKF